jgi:hypothetical protein
VAAVAAGTGFFTFCFATPNPDHEHPRPQSYRALRTWIDTAAFKNNAFCWYMASIAFLFFGFYPVFFNLEEVGLNLDHIYVRKTYTDTSPPSVGRNTQLRLPGRHGCCCRPGASIARRPRRPYPNLLAPKHYERLQHLRPYFHGIIQRQVLPRAPPRSPSQPA